MSSEVMVRVTREDAVRCLEELRGAIGELDGLLTQLQAAVREDPEAAFDVEMPHLLIAPCGAMASSVVPDPPPLLREAMDALGGLRVSDPDLDARLVARERRAATLPLLNDLARKRGRDGRCFGCEALGSCVVCPAAIARAPGPPDPYRVPDNQCDFNRLVARHRKSLLERLSGSGRTRAPRATARQP